MEKFTIHTGQSVPLMNDNIDTDQLIPKTYLKRVEKSGFGEFLFDDWRYLADRSLNPDFILNHPDYQQATILVAGDNFGSGSSREHAAWALMDYGFKAVIAGSFSDIFYMNATKNGLLPIVLDQNAREKIAHLPSDHQLTIDLEAQTVSVGEDTYHFDIDETWKYKLLNGLDEIGITLQSADEITAYEQTIPSYRA
ncbi:3-isopropylmalate dehydratase small subunit [Enterococcus cecorum]|jgi:3-isopropylmalate/(R)-2-methylmalate dehydratase small subunit|uniref:3-isopropylmalate dehydratase small subunit n=1 Tax=Enterococcus cecorum TaxID=44008 RepID=UPI000DE9A7E0|nr:3-isopropylmalate dehydratase small subunit [Enterococcus cecorum]NLL32250.1 3-isopropylmalate dehydratase small subunit [Enterococcus cecorum]RBR29931.1 3-isopropylmalate dehydratase, small subunit [Enterococcus cecorum]RBR35893.1 3-isopropylmalate dehydratase, small subunit [Enterococcus cecorum]RBR38068.1 3-isopropylmalate dehydratase, small subunit [Enterococcus cecorum]CAI3464062.1 3-isopropylmalate dehydratase small subunit [Enterococcus cecorum]